LLRGVIFSEQVAHLGAGHFVLELRTGEHRAYEAILVEEHALVECHIGDANRAFFAKGGIVAMDRNLMNRSGLMIVQTAMAVVIADRVRGAEVRYPSGFEQGDQPGVMLAGNRDWTRDRQGHRTTHSD